MIFYRRDLDFVFFAHLIDGTAGGGAPPTPREGFRRGSVTARGENGVMKREKGKGRGAARPLSGERGNSAKTRSVDAHSRVFFD